MRTIQRIYLSARQVYCRPVDNKPFHVYIYTHEHHKTTNTTTTNTTTCLVNSISFIPRTVLAVVHASFVHFWAIHVSHFNHISSEGACPKRCFCPRETAVQELLNMSGSGKEMAKSTPATHSANDNENPTDTLQTTTTMI